MIAPPHDANGANRHSQSDTEARTAASPTQTSPGHEQEASKPTHPLEPLLDQIAAVRAFALHYFEAQTDAVKATIRRALFKAAAGVVAAIVGVTFVIMCTIMLARGLAELISIAAGGPAWVGNLALGGGVLLILAVGVGIYIARRLRAAREQTIRKYENRHYAQRAKFGADVTERPTT